MHQFNGVDSVRQTQDKYQTHKQERTQKKIANTHTRCNTSDLAALVVEHKTVHEINTKSMQGGEDP